MSKPKRRHVDSSSSSDDYSSIDGTDGRRGKKRRAQRRLDHSWKALKEEMTKMKEGMARMKAEMTETRMKEEMTRMKAEMTETRMTQEMARMKEEMTQEMARTWMKAEMIQSRMKEEMAQMKEEMTRMKEEMSTEGLQRNHSEGTERINEQKDAILLQRPSPTSLKEENIRNFKLQCKTKLAQRVYTGTKLAGDQGTGIQIILIDADTNQVITTGIESSIKVHAVVLEGDFNREDHENWPREEFDGHIVKERQQRRPLLIGELQVLLKEGAGSLKDLTFTDNSSWNRSKMFRIGVRVASGYCEGTRIREALTDPFSVLEHRGESYMKHHPPKSSDDVWRLECIGKEGRFHKRLKEEGINNVEEFLQAYSKDPQALKNTLGNGMTAKKWNSLIDHAKTCHPNEKSVSDSEKQEVDDSAKIAHSNWKDEKEYAGLHGLDPVNGRSIIPHPAAALSFENHHEIPFDLASFHSENAGSSVAAEQASASQQVHVQAGETSMPHQPVIPYHSPCTILKLAACPLLTPDCVTNCPGGCLDGNICQSDFANTHN